MGSQLLLQLKDTTAAASMADIKEYNEYLVEDDNSLREQVLNKDLQKNQDLIHVDEAKSVIEKRKDSIVNINVKKENILTRPISSMVKMINNRELPDRPNTTCSLQKRRSKVGHRSQKTFVGGGRTRSSKSPIRSKSPHTVAHQTYTKSRSPDMRENNSPQKARVTLLDRYEGFKVIVNNDKHNTKIQDQILIKEA